MFLPPPLFMQSLPLTLTSSSQLTNRCRCRVSISRPRGGRLPNICAKLPRLPRRIHLPIATFSISIPAVIAAVALTASFRAPPAAFAGNLLDAQPRSPGISATTLPSRRLHARAAYVQCPPKRFALVTYKLGRAAEMEMLVRMGVAIGCGAMIGLERQASLSSMSDSDSSSRNIGTAGVRTLALVSLGSSVFTLTALLSLSGDAGRMGASISTGIGFLGAGTIHQDKAQRHLVTAASVWISAALGVAAASGLKFLAFVVALTTIAILRSKTIYFQLRKNYVRARRWRRRRLLPLQQE